jgi:hypothetical protein
MIFSHPSLGYDKSKFEFPIDLNKKYPANGSGLCNQLFKIINAMAFLSPKSNNIYFDLMTKDINTGDMCKVSDLINLKEINRIYGTKLMDITDFPIDSFSKGDYQICDDQFVFRTYLQSPQAFESTAKAIIWSEKHLSIANQAISEKNLSDKEVNLVHMRIDQDMKKHIIGNREDNTIDYSTEHWVNREKAYHELVDRYRDAIKANCQADIPLVILMDEVTHPLVKDLEKEYDVVFFEKDLINKIDPEISGREIYALIDLLIGLNLDAKTFIGLENKTPLADGNKQTSSFSVLIKHLTRAERTIMV